MRWIGFFEFWFLLYIFQKRIGQTEQKTSRTWRENHLLKRNLMWHFTSHTFNFFARDCMSSKIVFIFSAIEAALCNPPNIRNMNWKRDKWKWKKRLFFLLVLKSEWLSFLTYNRTLNVLLLPWQGQECPDDDFRDVRQWMLTPCPNQHLQD
jgi:hypothetical protein